MPFDRAPRMTPPVPVVIRVLCLSIMLGSTGSVFAVGHARSTGVTLKLDHEMTREGRTPPEVPPPAVQAGIDGLNEQAMAAEKLASALDRENRQWKAELSAREELISELEQTLASQDDIIRLLEDRAEQPAPAPVERPVTGVRTWGPAGWDPRELRRDALHSFMQSPTAVERALTVLVVLLLCYAIYLRLRAGRDRVTYAPAPARSGQRDAAERGTPVPRERDEAHPPMRERDIADAGPGVPQRARQQDLGDLNATIELPPMEFPATPPEPPRAPVPSQDADPPTVRLGSTDDFQLPDPPAAAPSPPDEPPADPPPAPRAPRKRADPAALREVDALIAFEHFEDAAELLAQAMADNPDNPEYRLRSLYIRNALGDYERFANDESILQAMMDGPMSDTLGRVLQTGRGLMPDSPLFESKEPADEAEPPITLGDEDIDDFNESTFIPLELEPDDEEPKPG